jgi:3,4-dihydroxy-2-butanone 4-phosphate synthase
MDVPLDQRTTREPRAVDLATPVDIARAEAALAALADGRAVVMVDLPLDDGLPVGHGYRASSEGYVAVAAEHCDADMVAFLATQACGLICLCLTHQRCEELMLGPLGDRETTQYGTDYRISVEAREGVTTGISAADRARTIEVAIDPERGPEDLVRPGHVLPLRARPGGVLERPGQTEAIVDLAALATSRPAGVICGILDAQGSMASGAEVASFCSKHGLEMCTVGDVVAYRLRHDRIVSRASSTTVTISGTEYEASTYDDSGSHGQHLALVKGDVADTTDALVVVRDACPLHDVFEAGGQGRHVLTSLEALRPEIRGVFLYLARDGAQLSGESRLACGCSTPDDGRAATIARQILGDLGAAAARCRYEGRDHAHAFTVEARGSSYRRAE